MPGSNTLINLANGFNAATKVRNLKNTSIGVNERFSLSKSSPEMLSEIIKTVIEYSPQSQMRSKSPQVLNAVDQSKVYLEAYRKIKSNMENTRGATPNARDIIGLMSSISPVVPVRQQQAMSKVIRIFEIMNEE